MQNMEQALLIVTGQAQGDIREALASLDDVLENADKELDPRLAHFLERRSYVKALAFITDEETAET